MHYNPSVLEAFNSVEHIMREVNNGLLIRYLHSNTASAFSFLVYLHVGLHYDFYKGPFSLDSHIRIIAVILTVSTLVSISICFNSLIPLSFSFIVVYISRLDPCLECYLLEIIWIVIGYYLIMYGFGILDLPEFLYINGGGHDNQYFSNNSGQPSGGGQPGGSGPNNSLMTGLGHSQTSTNNNEETVSAGQPQGSGSNDQSNPFSGLSQRQLSKKLSYLKARIEWNLEVCSNNQNGAADIQKHIDSLRHDIALYRQVNDATLDRNVFDRIAYITE